MNKNFNAVKTALLASFSFAGYNIGSGFATGVEGQQFYAAWGKSGAIVSLLIALICAAFIFVPVYLTGYRKKDDSEYNVYHYYCGDKIGTLIDWYMYLSMFLFIMSMMSGAGATINQYFGIPKTVGVIGLCALCIITALLGLKRLMRILGYAGVVIIGFVLVCAIYIFIKHDNPPAISFEVIDAFAKEGSVLRIGLLGYSSPAICGLAAAGLMVVSGMPWVASTGALCESKRSAIVSGLLSGLVFYAAQSLVVYLNLISFDKIAGAEIPLLAVFQNYLPSLALVYSAIIILAIFSTTSGRLFMIASRFDKGNRKLHIAITVGVIAISAILGNYVSFAVVSNIVFSISGCLGILLGIVIIIRTVILQVKKKKERL